VAARCRRNKPPKYFPKTWTTSLQLSGNSKLDYATVLFNTYEFILVYLPVTLLVFYGLRNTRYHTLTITCLVAASLFFYGWWNPNYLALIGFSVIINYCTGRFLVYLLTQGNLILQKMTLFAGIAVNLTLLGYFKYATFFVDNINALTDSALYLETIVLPIAISFFTFQQIAYLVDTKRRITLEHSFLQYCLFVVFFPQLIAGPIVHHKEMLPQFLQTKHLRPWIENVSIGGSIFCVGLFKKVVIADGVQSTTTSVFLSGYAMKRKLI